MTVSFRLSGHAFTALNGGPQFKLTEAISLQFFCDSQEEVDHFWSKLTAGGGQEGPCGWLKDRFGLSWQVVPKALIQMLEDEDPAKVARVTKAFLQMKRFGIAANRARASKSSSGRTALRAITVMTFESAYRRLDEHGAEFGLVVVDEAHHFGTGARAEALECLAAPRRLGLTATPPERGTPAAERLAELVGPTVFEIGVCALSGKHLAPFDVVRLPVALDAKERRDYDAAWRPFARCLRSFQRANPGGDWQSFVRALTSSSEGREILEGYRRAEAVASYPGAKRALVSRTLDRHADAPSLVFVGLTADAFDISARDLVPVVTAETSAREREAILGDLRSGAVRAIVAARVLNEGIDLPDAEVAVLVSGKLGGRELIQRVGRVLRPREGKRAKVYSLVTIDTVDERRVARSWRQLADA